MVTTVIFEAGDRDAVDGTDASGACTLCCTADMAERGDCTEGSVAYHSPNGTAGWPKVLAASFPPSRLDTTFPDETIPVLHTSMYTLLFIHCDASLAGGQVFAAGNSKTIWKNSRGYLLVRMATLLPFYGCASLAFSCYYRLRMRPCPAWPRPHRLRPSVPRPAVLYVEWMS